MTLVEFIGSSAGTLVLKRVFDLARVRTERDTEKHRADAAASADSTARHVAIGAGIEVTGDLARGWLERLAKVERELEATRELAKRFESLAEASERRAEAAESREKAAVRRADDADKRAQKLFEEFEEYKRADRAKADSDPPRRERGGDPQ